MTVFRTRVGKALSVGKHALVAIILFSAPMPAAAATPEAGVKAAIQRLWKAWETGDVGEASAVYDPSLIDTDFFGTRRQWPEVRAFLTPNTPDAAVAIDLRDFQIQFHGRAAVASYLVSDYRTRSGNRSCVRFAATDVLVKRQSGWRIVAAHQSMIVEKPTAQSGL